MSETNAMIGIYLTSDLFFSSRFISLARQHGWPLEMAASIDAVRDKAADREVVLLIVDLGNSRIKFQICWPNCAPVVLRCMLWPMVPMWTKPRSIWPVRRAVTRCFLKVNSINSLDRSCSGVSVSRCSLREHYVLFAERTTMNLRRSEQRLTQSPLASGVLSDFDVSDDSASEAELSFGVSDVVGLIGRKPYDSASSRYTSSMSI